MLLLGAAVGRRWWSSSAAKGGGGPRNGRWGWRSSPLTLLSLAGEWWWRWWHASLWCDWHWSRSTRWRLWCLADVVASADVVVRRRGGEAAADPAVSTLHLSRDVA